VVCGARDMMICFYYEFVFDADSEYHISFVIVCHFLPIIKEKLVTDVKNCASNPVYRRFFLANDDC